MVRQKAADAHRSARTKADQPDRASKTGHSHPNGRSILKSGQGSVESRYWRRSMESVGQTAFIGRGWTIDSTTKRHISVIAPSASPKGGRTGRTCGTSKNKGAAATWGRPSSRAFACGSSSGPNLNGGKHFPPVARNLPQYHAVVWSRRTGSMRAMRWCVVRPPV